jgi:hypothetical protein
MSSNLPLSNRFLRVLLEGRKPAWPGSLLRNNGSRGPFVETLLRNNDIASHQCNNDLNAVQQQLEPRSLLENIVDQQ